jgi:threonine/homoserine/homoserine lactone efflux protein
MNADLIAPAIAFLIAVGSPGPATLAVAGTAMASGRRAGLGIGFGLALGLAFWGALTAIGLGALVLGSPPALLTLRICGGAYLFWLAWKSARAAMNAAPPTSALPPVEPRHLFLKGLLLNLSNPKAALAWAAVIAIGLPPDASTTHITTITIMCTLIGLTIYAGYAIGFALSPVRSAYFRSHRWIEGILAVLFGYAGVRLLFLRTDLP